MLLLRRFSGKTVITAAPFSAAMGYVFGLVQKQRSRVRLAQAKANASLSRAGTASVAAKRLSHVYDADAPGAFDDFDDDDIGGGVGGFDDDGFAEAAAHSVAAGEARDNFEAADDDAVAVSLSRAFEANAARDVDTSQTYEELCKAHIVRVHHTLTQLVAAVAAPLTLCRVQEAYAASTQKYLLQTQLSKRVNDWREKIEPILEEEAARSEFNIHSYGDRIIHSLLEAAGADSAPASAVEDEEVEAKFDDIVGTTEVYEVCRMFLASLQLVRPHHRTVCNMQCSTTMLLHRLTAAALNSSMTGLRSTTTTPYGCVCSPRTTLLPSRRSATTARRMQS